MDLASGYSDSINYGNGYTPLATGAINNNNAAYAQQQAAMAAYAQAMQNNVFASGGGFGQQTADYAGAGAAYGRATGGFAGNSIPGGYPSGDVQRGEDLPNLSTTPDPFGGLAMRGGQIDQSDPGNIAIYNRLMGGGGSSFADRYSAAPAITPGLQPQGGDYSAFPNAISAGVDPSVNVRTGNSSFNSRFGAWPEQPSPATGIPIMNQGGQIDQNDPGNIALYYRLMGGGGGSQTQTPAPFGGPDTNTYGYPSSGSLGTGTGFGGYRPDTPSGRGGIGSDAVRDQMAWMLAQQSPYATPQNAPSNGPYPNLGYNPGMANSFANPTMQQYDWTANNAKLQQQMQDALKTIDGATGNQPAPPYGGELPPFWQGARDFFGMGAPQPTPTQDTWSNRS